MFKRLYFEVKLSKWPFTWLRRRLLTSKFLVYSKNQNSSWSLKKCFHVLFHARITNEVQVTFLPAYISLPRHIRKGKLERRIVAADLRTAVGCQQFRKASRKRQRRIMFECNYSFYHYCLLSCRYMMFQKQYFE